MYPKHNGYPRVGRKASRTGDIEIQTLEFILLQILSRYFIPGQAK